MNAYELADELQKCIDDESTDLVCVCDAANMLRQQADRIAELEQNLSAYIVELELHKAMIQDLEKELKRIKFAWNLAENEIERLTPQTKPLIDEEIDKILESLDVYIDTHAGVKLFARAIEERHGIK